MLLNPIVDDPREHITLDPETGIMGGITLRGKITIEILGLNREGLLSARQQAYRDARNAFTSYAFARIYHCSNPQGSPPPEDPLLAKHREGSAPYSLAGRLAVERVKSELTTI
jgi:hypothetical protein